MKLILAVTIFLSSVLYASPREQTIRLYGKVKENTIKRISVKEIEKGLTIAEAQVFNPYEKRSDLYGGVLINEFVEKYGVKDVSLLRLTAIDDYSIDITKKEWSSMRIILAGQMNKKYISIKEKGPLRIVFPDYDAKEQKYKDSITMWMWMIKKIEFK